MIDKTSRMIFKEDERKAAKMAYYVLDKNPEIYTISRGEFWFDKNLKPVGAFDDVHHVSFFGLLHKCYLKVLDRTYFYRFETWSSFVDRIVDFTDLSIQEIHLKGPLWAKSLLWEIATLETKHETTP